MSNTTVINAELSTLHMVSVSCEQRRAQLVAHALSELSFVQILCIIDMQHRNKTVMGIPCH
jgi:hypothetical protein